MQGQADGCAPDIDDINRMLDSLTNNLRACDQREADAHRGHHRMPTMTVATTTTAQKAPRERRHHEGDVIVEADPVVFACAPPTSMGVLPADPGVIFVDALGARASSCPPGRAHPETAADAPIIVCATEFGVRGGARPGTGHGTSATYGVGNGVSVPCAASTNDDAEPWAAPAEWWDAGVRCVFEWLREAFAAALDRDARSALRRHGVVHFFAWPPVGGAEATAGGASAACSLTLMLRPWTPADRPADAQRGRGGGPCGIDARRRDAENELAALGATAERVVARVEASGCALAERHAALSEAVRGCAACLRTLLRLAHDESQVLRAHGAATREAAVIATRAVAIAQKWIYARTAERVGRAAERYGAMDAALRYDFGRAEAAVRGQRARFLVMWRDLKTRYDAFLAAAGLDGADPAAAQAMEALFWRGAGGEPPIDPGSGDDPAVAVAAAAADASADHGVDPDAFDGDALRLLRYYCEHMANVARSMLDRTTEEDSDSHEQADDNDMQQDGQDDVDEACGGDHHRDHADPRADKTHSMPTGQRQRRRRRESHGAVDDAVSSVSSEARRHIAACVAGGDDRARVLAEMRRARDRCRTTARQIVARRRERARLLRPVRRRHVRRMRRAARDNVGQQRRRFDNNDDDDSNPWEPDPDEEDDDLLLLSSDDGDENDPGGGEGSRRRSADDDARARADQRQLEVAMAADAADARIEASARKRLADLESLMAGMAAQAVESGPHAEWMRATQRLGDALAEAQAAWRQAAEARAAREAVLEEETARCLESVAATARAAHEADVGAVLCQWNERQHGIDRRRAEDLRQIAMARRVADEWLANFERKMVYYHEDAACAEAVGAVGEFRAVMGLHAGARGMVVRLAEFADAYEDLAYAWSLAYRVEYGDEMPPDTLSCPPV
ncbi:hypothetical protein psal_cds_512 [Pandoravirus salinus]|uniref:Uncharacterized protein n=1 Tax=Pandoravirus salinus TaxID=1349410 RepID=S4VVC7_9VIRU|nr:hypothetical protein psal_cds_512 [Pandoravirus salinus]AGO84323.1 hypothetical protein psal_cds_512 [Pandoravirus salinus]